MNYKEYKESRNIAWEVLINEQIRELPVTIIPICRNMGIQVKLYTPDDDNSGYSIIVKDTPFIFIDQGNPISRQRFTAAHELGHILLGHVNKFDLIGREPSSEDNPIEQAANVFASRLLAPACVLWGCGARTPDDIMKLCDISYAAASFRMERMKELYRRNKFLTSPLERKVYEQFEDYIRSHKL